MNKILCAVDDSEHAKGAVALAAQLAKALGAELTLLAVNELEGIGGVSCLWDNEELKHVLDNATAAAEKAGVLDPKKESVIGRDVARAIVAVAEDNGFDHIVIGRSGKGGVSRLMLGSVSSDVVNRAHCPVTVAR